MTDIVERLAGPFMAEPAAQRVMDKAADEITALRAENERLRVQNIQMQAALGYGILAEDERHILPENPFKCGTCDASKRIRAENEKLRAALRGITECHMYSTRPWDIARAALEEKQ